MCCCAALANIANKSGPFTPAETNAQDAFAKSCPAKSLTQHPIAFPNYANNGKSACLAVANAHAVVTKTREVESATHIFSSVPRANAENSGLSNYAADANAQATLQLLREVMFLMFCCVALDSVAASKASQQSAVAEAHAKLARLCASSSLMRDSAIYAMATNRNASRFAVIAKTPAIFARYFAETCIGYTQAPHSCPYRSHKQQYILPVQNCEAP
eukprot:gnl/MRDRNA2_/MRDRNA2_78054_c0_seq2.p1 gnl/MRDRNA2_/MRDRNA2_78054_c0~~gnl/MRDRNA2_/MRDRNA2_78054_c0_seq2.p1  ORF type:complete len:216 (+),score=24.33 gnl/MRDRNA2_/MRDRNA2_78054_c0_seq2:542-1189(+)